MFLSLGIGIWMTFATFVTTIELEKAKNPPCQKDQVSLCRKK